MVVQNTLPSLEEVQAKVDELTGAISGITKIHFELVALWKQWLKAMGGLEAALMYARSQNLEYKEVPGAENLAEPPSRS